MRCGPEGCETAVLDVMGFASSSTCGDMAWRYSLIPKNGTFHTNYFRQL
jgi:hypothetical protein